MASVFSFTALGAVFAFAGTESGPKRSIPVISEGAPAENSAFNYRIVAEAEITKVETFRGDMPLPKSTD